MIKDQHIAQDAMIDPAKIQGRMFAKEYYAALSTGAMYKYLREKNIPANTKLFGTIPLAYAALVTGRNDVIHLAPDSHTLAAALAWANNLCHLKGQYPDAMMNHRSRIGHNADFTPMMTVSGYGNSFSDVYWMHGRGNAANLVGLLVSGARNSFFNCHIGGPMNAAEAGAATYSLLTVTGQENYFKSCTIGVDTIARSAANTILTIDATTCNRLLFEDCIFLSYASATSPFFIKITGDSGDPGAAAIFKNCTFINSIFTGGGGQALAAAISQSGNNYMYFDKKCDFFGCTKVINGLSDYVFMGSFNTAAGTLGLPIKIGS